MYRASRENTTNYTEGAASIDTPGAEGVAETDLARDASVNAGFGGYANRCDANHLLQFEEAARTLKQASYSVIGVTNWTVSRETEFITAGISDAEALNIDPAPYFAAIAIHFRHVLETQHSLVRRLLAVQEDERRADAYDLHDGLTKYVMTAYAHLQAYQCAESREESELSKTDHYLGEAVQESRRLVNSLRAITLDELGLPDAIEQLLDEGRLRYGWADAKLIHNLEERRFSSTLERTIFRVTQEAITNSGKHSGSADVSVTLAMEPGSDARYSTLTLTVQDWGCGFDPAPSSHDSTHIGLIAMRERVQLIGGEYMIDSSSGVLISASFLIPL